jgi:hypothetical protein
MIAGAKAIGGWLGDPVNVHADKVQQLTPNHGYFGSVDTVGTEHRTTAAFGALIEVVKPFLDDVFGQFPAARERPKQLASRGEVTPIDAAHEFRA